MPDLIQTAGVLQQLPIDQIDPHPHNPRLIDSPDFLDYLTNEMRRQGFPAHYAGLFRQKSDGRYETISAHRRVKAARAAGLVVIPGWVAPLTDEEALLELSKSNMQEGLTKLELAVHSFCVERASGKRGQGLKAFADQHKVDGAALSKYRRGAEVFMRVRPDLEPDVVAGCLERAEHLARIRKAPEMDWSPLVTSCVRDDWSITLTEKHVATRLASTCSVPAVEELEASHDVGDETDNATIENSRSVEVGELAPCVDLETSSTLDVEINSDGRDQVAPSTMSDTAGVEARTQIASVPIGNDHGSATNSEPSAPHTTANISDEDNAAASAPIDRTTLEMTLGEYYSALSFQNKRRAFGLLWLNLVREIGVAPIGPVLRHMIACEEPNQVGDCLRSLEAIVELILASPDLAHEVQGLRDLAQCFGPAVAAAPVVALPQPPTANPKPPAKASGLKMKKARRRKSA